MNAATLTALPDNTPCPFFFFNDNPLPDEAYYKIYNDGGHFIATPVKRSRRAGKRTNYGRDDLDILFDSLYFAAVRDGLKDTKKETPMTDYIKAGILKLFDEFNGLDKYIAYKIERKENNYFHRIKRFRRKARLNRWNYFVTITYDDSKHTADMFRAKLRRCLSNLHTRHKWRYMGVFEYAPETGRLHFHALIYVPHGQMIGKITERKDYSTKQGRMQTAYVNDFFEEAFGRNDFKEIGEMELKHTNAIDYITKYISKTGERIVYSRGVPSEICVKVKKSDIVTEMFDFVQKFILFDDVVDWERDVLRYTKRKQITFTDIICNPPQIA